MRELQETSAQILSAAALLLSEPDLALYRLLQQRGVAASLTEVRQIFYDRLVIPQSSGFLPPFEHVFRQRRLVSGVWHFPPARPDGAVAVERLYARFGFDPRRLMLCPPLRAPQIPADHLGFLLAFGALLLNLEETELLSRFVQRHLDGWVEDWCRLLPVGNASGYVQQVADAVQEGAGLVRQLATACPTFL